MVNNDVWWLVMVHIMLLVSISNGIYIMIDSGLYNAWEGYIQWTMLIMAIMVITHLMVTPWMIFIMLNNGVLQEWYIWYHWYMELKHS